MKVLYDHQAFLRTKYGGIPRYFNKLLLQFTNDDNLEVEIPKSYCRNYDYRKLFLSKPDKFYWKINDFIVDKTLRCFNENPARYLSNAYSESTSLIKKGEFDIFHPTFFEPYFLEYIGKKPYVLTIHDLSLELYPELVSLTNKTPHDTSMVIKEASRYIAVSKFTKKHFIEYYDVDADLVDVVYHGPTFNKIENNKNELPTHEKRYILYVNNRFGRKNFYTMLGAIKYILIEYDLNLICAGGGMFTQDELEFFKLHGVSDRIFYVNADDNKLIELYSNALAFVFPSIYEGFGIPILEAFACGCPVVLSNASCLPEVGGDAAVYFNPKDIVSMREAVCRVISDEKLRNKMRDEGYKQLEKFSWKKCARETKTVYEKVLE